MSDSVLEATWFNELDPEAQEAIRKVHDDAEANRRIAEKQRKDFEAAQEKLAQHEQEKRVAETNEAFKAAGVLPGAAEFYPKDAPLEPEKIREWGQPKGFVVDASTASAAATSHSATVDRSFVTSTPGALPAGTGAKISEAELDQIMRADPQRGIQLANSGQVDWSDATLRMARQENT